MRSISNAAGTLLTSAMHATYAVGGSGSLLPLFPACTCMHSAKVDAFRSLDMSRDEDSDSDEVDLQSSELGTHAYWQQAYARELDVLRDLGDEGEIWCPTAQNMCLRRHGSLCARSECRALDRPLNMK